MTAWEVFDQADTAMAVTSCVVLGLVALTATGALSARQDGVLVLAGLVAAGLVAFRLVNPPGADVPIAADLLHATTGAYVGLAGALLMAAGGVMAAMGQAPPSRLHRPPRRWRRTSSRCGTPRRRPAP